MKQLFRYNWVVRDEWFQLCSEMPHAELVKERIGGVGTILRTLFHIVDVECSWIQAVSGTPVAEPDFQDYSNVELVKQLSDEYRLELIPFVENWSSEQEYEVVSVPWSNETYHIGEILRHVLAHEIHHIGQLAIWTREMGMKPVSASFVGRGLMANKHY